MSSKIGSSKFSVILGVVLEIGVLHQNDVACGRLESAPQRGSLAGVLGLKEEADIFERQASLAVLHGDFALAFRLRLVKILQQAARAVGGFVVDKDDLLLDRRCLHAQQHLLDKGALVIDRDYDGHLHSDSRDSIRNLSRTGFSLSAFRARRSGDRLKPVLLIRTHDRLRMQRTQTKNWMHGCSPDMAAP